jgi:hypothetical protein
MITGRKQIAAAQRSLLSNGWVAPAPVQMLPRDAVCKEG